MVWQRERIIILQKLLEKIANSPRKGKEKIVEQGGTSRARGESSDSDMSLDEELGIPKVTTPC